MSLHYQNQPQKKMNNGIFSVILKIYRAVGKLLFLTAVGITVRL